MMTWANLRLLCVSTLLAAALGSGLAGCASGPARRWTAPGGEGFAAEGSGRPRANEDFERAIRAKLAAQGYTAIELQLPPPSDAEAILWYSKVVATNPSGEQVSLQTSRAGAILTHEEIVGLRELAASRRFARQGTLDDLSFSLLQTELATARTVELFLRPSRYLPDEPDPASLDPSAPTEGDALWRAYYRALTEAETAGLERLEKALTPTVKILGRASSGLSVVAFRNDVDALVRLPGVKSSGLADKYLPREGYHGSTHNQMADQDENMNWGPVRALHFDGNANGARIRVGVRDSGGARARAEFEEPRALTERTFRGIPKCCIEDDDCADLGTSACIDDERANDECPDGWGVCGTREGGIADHGAKVLHYLAQFSEDVRPVGAPQVHVYYSGNLNNDATEPNRTRNAVQWFVDNGVHIMNYSMGSRTIARSCNARASPHFWDDLVRNRNMVVLKSAGNLQDNAPGGACADCNGPNTICVGCASQGNQVRTHFSSANNLVQGDLERPDLLVPGSATSWCAPRTAAVVAALHDMSKENRGRTRPFPWLEHFPEATKALLMAAADINIHGDAVSRGTDLVDDVDGAGSINVGSLMDIWDSGDWSIRAVRVAGPRHTLVQTVHLNRGERLRAYLSWSRCPENSEDADPNLDLGIRIGHEGRFVYTADDSKKMTSEGVEYLAERSGDYRLYIHKSDGAIGCEGQTSETVGMAWQVREADCASRRCLFDKTMPCQCDLQCIARGDCCGDHATACGELVHDDFSEPPLDPSWAFWDHEGAEPASHWFRSRRYGPENYPPNGGFLWQSSNVHNPADEKRGTLARLAHSAGRRTYEVTIVYGTEDKDIVGVTARTHSAETYYVCWVNQRENQARLIKFQNGVDTDLGTDDHFFGAFKDGNTPQVLSLRVEGTARGVKLTCHHDGRLIFVRNDFNPIAADVAREYPGVYLWRNDAFYLYDIYVRTIPRFKRVPLPW